MRVLIMSPEEHDLIVALTSHLPHLAATGLVNLLQDFKEKNSTILSGVASGFRDTTRTAASSPTLWHDICMSNKEQIVSVLKMYRALLKEMEESISREEDQTLMKFLETAKKLRDALNKS